MYAISVFLRKKKGSNSMKNSVCSFVLVLLCIVLCVSVALCGVSTFGLKSVMEDDAINKGLDLVGGSSITFKALPDETNEEFDMNDALTKVETILRDRLDSLSYSEATIARVGDDQIRVEIPGISDPNAASETLGSTAKLEFKDADGNVIFEGDKVKGAVSNYGPVGNSMGSEHHVVLEFTSEGQKLFAEATAAAAARKGEDKNYIDIELDGRNISHASVEEAINNSTCTISGSFTQEAAVELAGLIDSGNLPVELEEIELRHVGATLGSDALSTSLKAGAIGILLVMIFMILIYRLPGFVSSLALVGYVAIFAILLVYFRVNLSLPGIAGIILTIGMAVDANVIIYERIKEELNVGKSVRNAVKNGFKGATSAIVDSNVTTIIAAVVLVIMGTGAVYGFGITLLIGTLVSMFTALVVTRVFLTALANMGVGSWIMGGKRNRGEN